MRHSGVRRGGLSLEMVPGGRWGAVLERGRRHFKPAAPRPPLCALGWRPSAARCTPDTASSRARPACARRRAATTKCHEMPVTNDASRTYNFDANSSLASSWCPHRPLFTLSTRLARLALTVPAPGSVSPSRALNTYRTVSGDVSCPARPSAQELRELASRRAYTLTRLALPLVGCGGLPSSGNKQLPS